MKVAAVIQARCGSTRFPNKVFADLCGHPLIFHVVNRLRFAKSIDEIVLATTTNPLDDKLEEWGRQQEILIYRGSENNVLNRFFMASELVEADIIIRITADDPFKEPSIIDKAVGTLIETKSDFVCNNNPATYPEGLDVEVFTKEALNRAERFSDNAFEREHVTQYFYRHPCDFKIINISNSNNLSHLRWTIDTDEDFFMTQKVYSQLYKDENSIFYMNDILNLLKQQPEIAEINSAVARSEMYKSK